MPYSDQIKQKEYSKNYLQKWYQAAKKRYAKKCPVCKVSFTSRYEDQTTCSLHCAGLNRRSYFVCKTCSKSFSAPPSKKRLFCSIDCSKKAMRTITEYRSKWYTNLIKGLAKRDNSNLVRLLRQEKGNQNRNWKGKHAKYNAIHAWVNSNFQRSNMCVMCKENKPTQWANIDHQYSRDRQNWMELCPNCHASYDRSHNLRFNIE